MKKMLLFAVIALCIPVIANATITSETYTSVVGAPIPDATSSGAGTPLYDTIAVPLGRVVAGVEVYIDISIVEWSSDLIVKLTSPQGTELRLFFIGEGGEPGTNPAGWYPTDFTPKDDMSAWIGQLAAGDWVLKAQDYSQSAQGTLNEWRLKIIYDDELPNEEKSWGEIKSDYR